MPQVSIGPRSWIVTIFVRLLRSIVRQLLRRQISYRVAVRGLQYAYVVEAEAHLRSRMVPRIDTSAIAHLTGLTPDEIKAAQRDFPAQDWSRVPLSPDERVVEKWRELIEEERCGSAIPVRRGGRDDIGFQDVVRSAIRGASYMPFLTSMQKSGLIEVVDQAQDPRVVLKSVDLPSAYSRGEPSKRALDEIGLVVDNAVAGGFYNLLDTDSYRKPVPIQSWTIAISPDDCEVARECLTTDWTSDSDRKPSTYLPRLEGLAVEGERSTQCGVAIVALAFDPHE